MPKFRYAKPAPIKWYGYFPAAILRRKYSGGSRFHCRYGPCDLDHSRPCMHVVNCHVHRTSQPECYLNWNSCQRYGNHELCKSMAAIDANRCGPALLSWTTHESRHFTTLSMSVTVPGTQHYCRRRESTIKLTSMLHRRAHPPSTSTADREPAVQKHQRPQDRHIVLLTRCTRPPHYVNCRRRQRPCCWAMTASGDVFFTLSCEAATERYWLSCKVSPAHFTLAQGNAVKWVKLCTSAVCCADFKYQLRHCVINNWFSRSILG